MASLYYTFYNNYIDLSDLPKKKLNNKQTVIDYEKVKGNKVKFKYKDIEDYLIISYYEKNEKGHIMELSYRNRKIKKPIKQVKRCMLGNLVTDLYSYKLKVGEVINNSKVLKHIRMGKNKNRGYEMLCLETEQKYSIREDHVLNGVKSPYTSNKKVWKGNALATTHPNLLVYLKNKESGKKVTAYSDKKIECKCPNCGHERDVVTKVLVRGGYFCPKCSKKVSYPEKFVSTLLELNNIKYINQKIFRDCKIKSYLPFDFYLPDYNCVIETHGLQHYSSTSKRSFMNIDRNKKYDLFKKEYCKNKGIKYIELNCSISEFDYMLKIVRESPLNQYIKEYDILELKRELNDREIYVEVDKIIDEYKKGESYNFLSKKYNIKTPTLILLLKRQGVYENRKYTSKVKIICLNNKKVFESLKEGREWCVGGSKISEVCKGKRKSAGKHPETGEPLKWMYYEDYINQQKHVTI